MTNSRGFTLIELLVVIAIIGLLSAIVLASLVTARSKANDARRMSDLHNLQTALELYYSDHGAYPIANCISSPWWNCWGSSGEPRLLPATYIATMPQDPAFADLGNACSVKNASRFYSYYSDNGQRYILAANLETPILSSDSHYYNGSYGCTYYANWAINNGF